MRVLCVDTLQFKEFHSLPDKPYAILSHVWGPTEEITYEDMTNPFQSEPFSIEGKDEASAKLRGCREQARKDELEYFWIDTCCINKPNYTELSEAINSMFHWYQKSEKCYAYLADATTENELSDSTRFLRGWTLQELVAPNDVVLFGRDWNKIGDKHNLAFTISEITKIPEEFLLGRNLEQASVAQRMSWVSKRKTSKEEDLAYCLFGIFDVHMPLLYGERLAAAFRRLQLEILNDNADTSIFAWMVDGLSTPFKNEDTFSLLALSPAAFETSHSIVCADLSDVKGFVRALRTPILLNNRGLHFSLPVVQQDGRKLTVALGCTEIDKPERRMAIKLQDISANNGRFARYGILTSLSTTELTEKAHFKDITTEMRLFKRLESADESTWRKYTTPSMRLDQRGSSRQGDARQSNAPRRINAPRRPRRSSFDRDRQAKSSVITTEI